MASLKEEYELRKTRAKPDGPYSLRMSERLIPLLLTILIPVAGAVWSLYTYNQNQHEIARIRSIDADSQIRAKLVELQKPFIEHQFATYKDLTQIVGELLSFTGDRAEWDKNFYKYWRLHYGPVTLVEDENVHDAKIKYGSALQAYTDKGSAETRKGLEDASQELIKAMNVSLSGSWTTGKLGTKN
jgi:hypothetical protein